MQIFIDTNIFLSFYSLTNEDLEELKKLDVLLQQKQAILLLPEQVIAEYRRNRESKIAEALKKLNEQKLNLQFPALCKDYPEFKELRDCQERYDRAHSQLVLNIKEDVNNRRLKADRIIAKLFSSARELTASKEIILKAKLRYEKGNPPGKNRSLGDAINWELLLDQTRMFEDIYFITDDKDYHSPIDNQRFSEFLSSEWKKEKNSELIFYRSISRFFRNQFPHIKLASQYEKDLAIRDYANSTSFAMTHVTVAKLRKHDDFSDSEINAIVSATIENDQIYWIIQDEDVKEFIEKAILGREMKLDTRNLERLQRLLEGDEEIADHYLDEVDDRYLDEVEREDVDDIE